MPDKKKPKITKKNKSKLPAKVIKYLDEKGINYRVLEHKTVYTALDAAMTMKKKLAEISKSLLIKADKDYYLIVLPADQNLDFKKLEKLITDFSGKKVKAVKIPGEKIMEDLLKVKAGAISAFGQLHKLPVIVEKSITKNKNGVFASGSFNHSIEMATKEFVKLENAVLGIFGAKKKIKANKTSKSKKTNKKNKTNKNKKINRNLK